MANVKAAEAAIAVARATVKHDQRAMLTAVSRPRKLNNVTPRQKSLQHAKGVRADVVVAANGTTTVSKPARKKFWQPPRN